MAFVDVWFRIMGNVIPVDHGFLLFSAISGLIPELHNCPEMGLHPISGPPTGQRNQLITEHSFIGIRLPTDLVSAVLQLAGKTLRLGNHSIRVGVPSSRGLIPSPRLYSRLVIIKGFMEPEPFLEAVKRQMQASEVRGRPYLVEQPHIEAANREREPGTHSAFLRRTTRIHDKEVVGFAVGIDQLTAEESILIQEKGIGGRRRFGCGIFVPDRR